MKTKKPWTKGCGHARDGFTLIELLVVISIIALLVSILLPSLQRAREQARAVVCMTQLKDIGTATYMYSSDHKDSLPPSYAMNAQEVAAIPTGWDPRWYVRITPYYERVTTPQVGGSDDYELFRCPTQDYITKMVRENLRKGIMGVVPSPKTGNPINAVTGAGVYGFNIYFTGRSMYPQTANPETYFSKLETINTPSTVPLIADLSAESTDPDFRNQVSGAILDVDYPHPDAEKYGWPLGVFNATVWGVAPNHLGKINYLWADFHCEAKSNLWPFHDFSDPYSQRRQYFHPKGKWVSW